MKFMTVPDKFWAEALQTAVHIRNATPKSVLEWKNTREKW